MARQERILVGVITGACGEIRLTSFCAAPEAIADYFPLYSEDGHCSFRIELTGKTSKHLTAKLHGIGTREQADHLRGTKLFAKRESLPDLPEGEYYHSELVGLDVRNTSLAKVGRVVSVQNHGASDILEISRSEIENPILLAFTRDTVPKVDLANGYIVVDLPDEGKRPDRN